MVEASIRKKFLEDGEALAQAALRTLGVPSLEAFKAKLDVLGTLNWWVAALPVARRSETGWVFKYIPTPGIL